MLRWIMNELIYVISLITYDSIYIIYLKHSIVKYNLKGSIVLFYNFN